MAGRGRVVVVFQPHLYSRTRYFADQFGAALGLADEVVVMDVYAAREDPMPGVTGALVAATVPLPPAQVVYEPSWSAVAEHLADRARPGDIVLTCGAGDVTMIGPEVLARLEARRREAREVRRDGLVELSPVASRSGCAAGCDVVGRRGSRCCWSCWARRCVLGAAAWVLLGSSVFGVAQVQVQGISRVGQAEVVDAADIRRGTPLARVDTAAVAARVASIPAVARRRGAPRLAAQRDHRGARAGAGSGAQARLGLRAGRPHRCGVRPGGHAAEGTAAGERAGQRRAAGAARRAGRARRRTADDPRPGAPRCARRAPRRSPLQLTRGRTVVWGDPGLGPRKGAVLAVLLSRKARVYDVSVPDAPTTRK